MVVQTGWIMDRQGFPNYGTILLFCKWVSSLQRAIERNPVEQGDLKIASLEFR